MSTLITSTVRVTDLVALYTVEKILLPKDIFGLLSPSPTPGPSHVSILSFAVDNPSPKGATGTDLSSNSLARGPSSKHSAASFVGAQQSIYLLVAIAAGALLLF